MTWAGPRCVQELANILGPQNRIRDTVIYNAKNESKASSSPISGKQHFQN